MRFLVAACIFTAASLLSTAQDAEVLRTIADAQRRKSEAAVPRAANFFRAKETSELRLVLSAVVRAYQLLISSQDTDACNFEPSCSRFGMLAMQRFGVARGFLLTGDRLTRCNGATDRHYERSQQSGKHLDPVDTYDTYLSTNP